jgi:hypothetical protein
MSQTNPISRQAALRSVAVLGVTALVGRLAADSLRPNPLLTKKIPSSGEEIPVVGLGSWSTFNVGDDPEARSECTEVMRRFFGQGGPAGLDVPMGSAGFWRRRKSRKAMRLGVKVPWPGNRCSRQ